jgi:hypothetical protein
MKRIFLILSLVAVSGIFHGCDEKGTLTILFTSDVKGQLTPAG